MPDMHGGIGEEWQADWIEKALEEAGKTSEIVGINYWVNVGGSTRLWNDDGTSRKAADILKKFYTATKLEKIP
jgi:hypothetical protein